MVRYSFLVRLSHPLLHAGLSRRILDHPIRPRQHVGRNREADLFGCFQIDDELELCWLLHGKVLRLPSLQDLVHIDSATPPQVSSARAVRHGDTLVLGKN